MSHPVIGVDEAGRGPVIGPLVVCALSVPEYDCSTLRDIGAKDSKLLSTTNREKIAGKIGEQAESSGWGIGIVICEPSRIDSNSLHSNLNRLEVELFAEAIQSASEDAPEGIIMVDSCDVDESRFSRRIAAKLGQGWSNWRIDSRHAMDSIDPVTGAASILAKVSRDGAISRIEQEVGFPIGSGYPSDAVTRKAVKRLVSGNLPHKDLRWSWSTVSDLWKEVHDTPTPSRSEDERAVRQTMLEEW
ncbi:MAG: ribonuclease HII [Candidatus Thermoplasmatota archaeon]|nr:ribonuclease HII [Candidatus Thermoplasmatota archaeon]MEE3315366.1 ribonuclease HII [Candidatus Thermoplasmatota archaeon]